MGDKCNLSDKIARLIVQLLQVFEAAVELFA